MTKADHSKEIIYKIISKINIRSISLNRRFAQPDPSPVRIRLARITDFVLRNFRRSRAPRIRVRGRALKSG